MHACRESILWYSWMDGIGASVRAVKVTYRQHREALQGCVICSCFYLDGMKWMGAGRMQGQRTALLGESVGFRE